MDKEKKERLKKALRAQVDKKSKSPGESDKSAAASAAARAKALKDDKAPGASKEPPSRLAEEPGEREEKLKKSFQIIARAASKFSAAPFALTATLTGHDLWKLDKQEAKDLGDAMEAVVERYAPWLIKYHPELVALCFCFAALAGPRAVQEVIARRVEKGIKKVKSETRIKNPDPGKTEEED